jgi:phosphatidylserine/phosphatidylglycerophosphate/cardiolipin synthase-like enzyme
VSNVEEFVYFAHFFRITQALVALIQQLTLLRIRFLLQSFKSKSNTHALQELALRHDGHHFHLFVHFGDLLNLLKVDIRSKIKSSNLTDYCIIVFDKLMVFYTLTLLFIAVFYLHGRSC